MKKFAAHRLWLSASEQVQGPVVVILSDEGTFSSFFLLGDEMPATEWLGGTFLLLPEDVDTKDMTEPFCAWFQRKNPAFNSEKQDYRLWHAEGVPADIDFRRLKTLPYLRCVR